MQHTHVVYWPMGQDCPGCGQRVRLGTIRYTLHRVDGDGLTEMEVDQRDVQLLLRAVVVHQRQHERQAA